MTPGDLGGEVAGMLGAGEGIPALESENKPYDDPGACCSREC